MKVAFKSKLRIVAFISLIAILLTILFTMKMNLVCELICSICTMIFASTGLLYVITQTVDELEEKDND